MGELLCEMREQRTAPFRPSVWRTIYDVDANHSWEISGAPFTMEPKSCRCCQESTFSTTISMVDPSQPSPLLHALAGSLGGAIVRTNGFLETDHLSPTYSF